MLVGLALEWLTELSARTIDAQAASSTAERHAEEAMAVCARRRCLESASLDDDKTRSA